nr:translation initiation factor IF-2-like [Pongo abelii]
MRLGELRWGGSRGPPLPDGAFRDPRELVLRSRVLRSRVPHYSCAGLSKQGAARRGGRGKVRSLAFTASTSGASRSPALPAGPDPCSSPASTAGARPGICVLPRARGVRGAAPSSAWVPAPIPETGPAGPWSRVHPPALPTVPAPGPGGAGPRARPARTHLCLPSPHGARSNRESFSGPSVPGGGEAEAAGAGAQARQPQAGAGCAPQPRRVRPAEAALRAVRCVRGAPAAIREAIQLPGLISSRGVRLGAGSQRARPRGLSRRRGGDGGVPGQPSALARWRELFILWGLLGQKYLSPDNVKHQRFLFHGIQRCLHQLGFEE